MDLLSLCVFKNFSPGSSPIMAGWASYFSFTMGQSRAALPSSEKAGTGVGIVIPPHYQPLSITSSWVDIKID